MDGSPIPCHRVVMRLPARLPQPRPGRREGLARVVRPAALALLLGTVGAASACLPELGSSCNNDTPTGFGAPPTFADEQIDDARRRALQWLRCQAAFDAPAPKSVSTSLGNLIRNFSDGSAAQTDRVVALLDTSIERCRRGQALREWLDNAVDLLKAARAAG